MISIELIFPQKGKRLCMRVGKKTLVGDLKKYIRTFFGVGAGNIFLLTGKEDVSDDMTLEEAGMYTGSGVVIDNG